MLKKFKHRLRRLIDNEFNRIDWVKERLACISEGSKILDAGCGSQQYKKFCSHLDYSAQDYGGYSVDDADSFAASKQKYEYGKLDYQGNIWDIAEKDETFDVILCTEVLEHIPYPQDTIKEFSRLLKPGGSLILTFPSNCLRHMDPFFYSSGYSDHFIKYFTNKYGLEIVNIDVVGSYHNWMMVEVFRTIKQGGVFSGVLLLPAFLFYYFKQKEPTQESINTLCAGYHVVASKLNN